jgi:multidrug efflux pump subunit AcrA (membrane-fusion protein)
MKILDIAITDEIRQALEQYVALQAEEQRLKETKAALQEKLKSHMAAAGSGNWFVEAGGSRLKVAYRETPEIVYNEELLRGRLGDRYTAILSPDARKIKDSLDRVSRYLEPVLGLVGSPSRAKVRAAVAEGIVRAEEFKGAFEKVTKQSLAVRKARPDEWPP